MAQEIRAMAFGERVRQVWYVPFVVGLSCGILAIGLSVFGMARNPEATPLNLRSLLIVIVLAGGSWSLLACGASAIITLAILILQLVRK